MDINTLSVETYIQAVNIIQANHYESEIDREIEILSCLTGKSEEYYSNMLMSDFKKARNKVAFINIDNIAAVSPRYIKANGKTYAPVYEFDRLTAAQLLDVTHFIKDATQIVNNLPQILASICVPTKQTLRGRKLLPYLAVSHKQVAEDFKKASIVDGYGVAVFFYQVWKSLIETTGGYLVREVLRSKTTRLTEMEKAGLLNILQMYGDGTTPLSVSL